MPTPWPAVALAAVLGLVVGSFLNVVIHRVPREESVVSPPSHCPRCDVRIRARHNVPVISWLLLRGRCASCGLGISARYPLVEAATGVLYAAVTLRFGVSATLPAFLYLATVAVVLTMIDFDVRRLPDAILLPSYVVSLALLIPAGAMDMDWHPATRGMAGGLLLGLLVFTLALALPANVSFGNAKLAGLLGIYLGWLSWGTLLVALVGTVVVAAAAGRRITVAAPVPAGGRHGGRALPLGPFLIGGTVLTVFAAAPAAALFGALLTG
ncbi:leader peptidase (prepilin peptidase) / N-methyltransferase [Jatrophihabitans endophyticus]|uniref:Leader peptidase (Prepilin peptidase) / N-methyltransferase n=1 Tax=Jatrophihabitans endophyticus TaxID=1206085 RepID=A0A1M5UF18_9ACTN|nr:A24 family peptidase [Jatrophihabitans endophyticus]SHH61559.1 leader peptidase (prepilin peptidase) / N-methyltransferase [Jatrophihabitans endophyticus]